MRACHRRFLWWLCVAVVALAVLPASAQANPEIRVLRMTLAQGDVQVNPNNGAGWQQAIQNMPVPAGSTVRVARDSTAEIEFEDGSSIRLLGPAEIVFAQLSLSWDGAPLNTVRVDRGDAYINAFLDARADFRIEDSKGNAFLLVAPSELSFQVGEKEALISVMEGQVRALNLPDHPILGSGESYAYSLVRND